MTNGLPPEHPRASGRKPGKHLADDWFPSALTCRSSHMGLHVACSTNICGLQLALCCGAWYVQGCWEGHVTVLHVHADEIDELQVLDMEYEVEWLQPGEDDIEGVREVLARGQIGRKRSPLTRLLLKSWLQEAATANHLRCSTTPALHHNQALRSSQWAGTGFGHCSPQQENPVDAPS